MKKHLLTILVFMLASLTFGQANPFVMVGHDGSSDKDYIYDIWTDDSGNKYITGKFKGAIDFGNGVTITPVDNYDIYVAKYNEENIIQWAKSFGGPISDEGRTVAVDSEGNVIVTASFFKTIVFGTDTLFSTGNFDIAVVKFDSDGNYLWMKQAYSKSKKQDKPSDMKIDNQGNYVFIGYYGDNAVDTLVYEGLEIESNGEREVFVIKMDSDGNPIWGVTAGGPFNDYSGGLVIDEDDNIYFNGNYNDAPASFGDVTLPHTDGYEIFTAKLNSSGVYQWAVAATGAGDDKAYDIDYIKGEDPDSSFIIIAGRFKDSLYVASANTHFESNGKYDIIVLAYTSSGDFVSGYSFGGTDDDEAKAINYIEDTEGEYYVSGISKSDITTANDTLTNYGRRDVLIMRMKQDSLLWVKNYGGDSEDYLNAASINDDGVINFAGNFKSSTANFDSFSLNTKGDYDLWFGQMEEASTPNLYINEFLASNDSSYYDPTTNDFPDWIEIYNAGDEPVDIGGMYITDDLTELNMWQIPTTAPDTTTIPAGGFLTLLADKKTEAGVLHVNLKLGSGGEQIGLTLADATTIVDSLTYGAQTTDVSEGRNPDGSDDWNNFTTPTPGVSNTLIAITFEVDMSVQIEEGNFDDSTGTVYLAGSMTTPQWGDGRITMVSDDDDDEDKVYYATLYLKAGDNIEFKFMHGNTWESISNRTYTVPNESDTFTAYFNDIESSVEQIDSEIPSVYALEQNYPNPFNPTTVINFAIPESGLVTLKVFNILGQEVAELINEVKSAGSYQILFDAATFRQAQGNASLTTGMYIYRIQSGNFTSTKKMLLVK